MPENSVYGNWPASGEIDIVESKGNDPEHYPAGRDSMVSALVSGVFNSTEVTGSILILFPALGSYSSSRCILENTWKAQCSTNRLQREIQHLWT